MTASFLSRVKAPLWRWRSYILLGPTNLARVAAYRLSLRYGVHPVRRLRANVPAGPFFDDRSARPSAESIARQEWREEGLWFGAHPFPTAQAPDWHMNPFTGARANAARPWFEISDFDPQVGDIKTIWEASRFDWLLAMAQRAALGDAGELKRANIWLEDWAAANPPYRGVNWKCGQEAAIRVMHLALAAIILNQTQCPLPGLAALVKLHLRRIAPTVSYAIGQQNNHGVSEAAALFIGGSWLEMLGERRGRRWAHMGRRLLEERARALIGEDGGFSQYSLVYHRLMLDCCALSESWRRRCGLPAFSDQFRIRIASATLWMQQMIDATHGDGPNYGANDGARLMALTDSGYRDFRPSLQWAAILFCNARAIDQPGIWDQPAHWLGLPLPDALLPPPAAATLDDSGIHILRQDKITAYLRYPRFRFRPGQSDALHLDLWMDGRNILRDGGTYSYAASPKDHAYFSGVAAHNSVQFDGRDQMPRISRFLFGAWLKAKNVRPVTMADDGMDAAAGYTDWQGATHNRYVRIDDHGLLCIDRLSGDARQAVLRWRLNPGEWRRSGPRISDGKTVLEVMADDPAINISLATGRESRFYLDQQPLPVLEVTVRVPAIVSTRIRT